MHQCMDPLRCMSAVLTRRVQARVPFRRIPFLPSPPAFHLTPRLDLGVDLHRRQPHSPTAVWAISRGFRLPLPHPLRLDPLPPLPHPSPVHPPPPPHSTANEQHMQHHFHRPYWFFHPTIPVRQTQKNARSVLHSARLSIFRPSSFYLTLCGDVPYLCCFRCPSLFSLIFNW